MGIKIAMNDPIEFFQKLLPDHVDRVKKMIGAGVEVKLGFFSVQFTKGGKSLSNCSLPAATTTLLNGTAAKSASLMAVTGLTQTVIEAYEKVFPGKMEAEKDEYKVVGTLQYNGAVYESGEFIELLPEEAAKYAGVIVPVKQATVEQEQTLEAPVKPKPAKKPAAPVKQPAVAGSKKTNGKVPLVDAEALLQPVKGTDEASTYYAVALSQDMKVGARVRKTALSIRIEGNLSKADEIRASGAGFTKATEGHLSVHVDCKNVPPIAVLGGLLFRLGTTFDQVLTNEKEFPHEG